MADKENKEPRYLTAFEVARRYSFLTEGVPNAELVKLAARRGQLPRGVMLNPRRVVWRTSELDAWEESLPRTALAKRPPTRSTGRRRGRPTKAEQQARLREGIASLVPQT